MVRSYFSSREKEQSPVEIHVKSFSFLSKSSISQTSTMFDIQQQKGTHKNCVDVAKNPPVTLIVIINIILPRKHHKRAAAASPIPFHFFLI